MNSCFRFSWEDTKENGWLIRILMFANFGICRTALHSGRTTSRFRAPFHDVAGLPTSPYPDQRRLLVCQIILILVGGMCFLVADLISISLVTTDMEHRVFTEKT